MKKNCLILLLVVFAQFLSFSQQKIKRAPACGIVGFDWKTPSSIPVGNIFIGCPNTNYELKADPKLSSLGLPVAGEYIAPGFDIVASGPTYDITKVRVQAGTAPYQTAYSGGPIFASFPVTYSAPSYSHNIEVTATAAGPGDKIEIKDHATGAILMTVPITSNTFTINLPAGFIKGDAKYTGQGVSNYQLNYPSTGKTDYTFNGYAVFNPSVAGNGTHTISYTWNNGSTTCTPATPIIVEVKDCPTPAVPCGTCATPDCPIGSVANYKYRWGADDPINCSPNSYTICPGQGAQVCRTGVSITGNTNVTYQTVTTDINGNIGAYIQRVNDAVPISFTITSSLYTMSDCNGTPIPPSKFSTDSKAIGIATNVHNRSLSSGDWNPEWSGLLPNTNYILKTTFDVPSGKTIIKYCMDYYGSTSCTAKIGTTKVTINGATPPTGKNLTANHYLLCKNDRVELKTTGFTLPPVGSGGTSGIGYMPYVCPPTPGKDPHTDACWASNDTYDILNPSSDMNDGTIIAQFPTATNQTYYFVPITMDEAISGSMNYDENSDGCYQTGTPIKVTYLKDIALSKNEVCASSKVTITISGGAPEFVSSEKYRISTNIGTLSAKILNTSGGTVDLTGLSNGDNYTISVSDTTGCNKTISGTYTCTCTAPTITGLTQLCEDATLTLTGSGTEAATNPWVAQNTNVTISATGGQTRTITGVSAGTCDITYKDNSGCSKTVTVIINDNPTLTATPTSILVNGTSSVSVSGGSGIGAASNAWKTISNTANILSGVTGNTQPITVTGVASGNEDIIYTDNKGCDDTVTIAVSILGCNTITKITPDQTWCQGIDPNALEFSTNETATDGISFVVFPAASKPVNAAAVYTGVTFTKKTPLSSKVLLDLPTLGSTISGALPVVLAGEYYIYAILTSPNTTSCRSNAEIKVTIKDSIIPVITAGTITSNNTTFTWSDIPSASKFGVDTARLVNPVMPFPWKSANDILNTTAGTGNSFTFNSITLGQTAHIKITPLDNTNNKLACSNSAISSILNPSCTNPVLLPLNIPDTVCAGESLEKLIGKISSSSVLVNFEWISSTDCINWSPIILPSSDYDTISTTLFKEQTLEIKNPKRTMNNTFIRLVGYDKVTGQCSDSTLPVKILVNEIPDATISIFPDPAKLCVGDPNPIEVTFQGSKGVQPYRFDFKLDGVAKDTTTATIPGDGKAIYKFNTDKTIDDSVFILEKVTDKNGCNATITNQTVKMQVISIPLLDFQADKTIGCYPLEVIFTDKSAVLNSDVVWDFGNGDLDSTSLGVVKYVFQKSGDYTINFKSTINGCWDTVQKTNYIRVKDRPEAQFSPKKTNISLIDPEIQFVNSSSSNSVYYKWIFGDGSPVSNLENPKHMYIGDGSTGLPDPGKYTVELYAYINQDCWDSTSTIITIDDEQIYYIPNTFTPNGDEKNNTFQPVFTSGYDAQNYHFLIYNRWGELIFESNNPVIGWDGTYGDKLLGNDTYTWKLQFKEKMTEKEHYLTGHVNLLK